MGDLETLESASFLPAGDVVGGFYLIMHIKKIAFTGVSAGVHVRMPARKR